ncbi:MAG: patatin-like phospholipase family protein [Thermomicrobiales bacterium]
MAEAIGTSGARGGFVDLVFEGGGVKGIGLVGALSLLEERGYRPRTLGGASAGAIVATLRAAGYTAAELREIVLGLDYRQFSDRDWEDRIPFLGAPLSILKDRGIYEGEAFLDFMQGLLRAKQVRTFSDLIDAEFAEDTNPLYRYRAQVIVSDLTERRLLVLPRDAHRLGVEPNDLDVALAVRMSMSIPIFFEPVRFRNPKTGREHLIVDGGMLSNFPVWLFDAAGVPEWPTFGLKLVEPDPVAMTLADRLPDEPPRRGIAGVIGYVKSLVSTMVEAHDRFYIEENDFQRTIPIATLGVRTTEFDLPVERAIALFEEGRRAGAAFLTTWDFEAHKAQRLADARARFGLAAAA